jgi:hypothetical protein
MMQPGMAANPFMTGNAAMGMNMGGGMGGANPFFQESAYVNPNHNKNMYNDSGNNMIRQGGPSNESWMRDGNDRGFNVNMDIPKKADNDNIKEF